MLEKYNVAMKEVMLCKGLERM